MKAELRYQDCPWYIRLWRRRYYLGIPKDAVILYWYNGPHRKSEENDWPLSFRCCWSIAIGSAQCSMSWLYEWKDLKKQLNLDSTSDEEP